MTKPYITVSQLLILMCATFFFSSEATSGDFDVPKNILAPRVLTSENFPCSECHSDLEPDPERRELDAHEEIVFTGHFEKIGWCLNCHNPTDRDTLKMFNGEKVAFNSSHKICGQCHGPIYKDWKKGVHGKRLGRWNGPYQYYQCTTCHNPHNPGFKPLQPKRPPLRPEETLLR